MVIVLLKRWQRLTHWCNKQDHYIFFFLKSPILLQKYPQCLQLKIWNKGSQVSDSSIPLRTLNVRDHPSKAFGRVLFNWRWWAVLTVALMLWIQLTLEKKAIASHSYCQSQLRAIEYYFRDYEVWIPVTDNLKVNENSFEMYNSGLGLLLLKIMLVCAHVSTHWATLSVLLQLL